ncbi:hypothetical protein FBUS_05529 [Fasciolopsis buskii]|uniref:Uncharacterized protein n=1 Tax=Fasciolopsis buskii TaxID=27845 RepID=A0A8E0VNH3_9TREM|nr:hypothetical protein FBUS_05529 [Fasciolopsis buski]
MLHAKLLLTVVTFALVLHSSRAQTFSECVPLIKKSVDRCFSMGIKYSRCDKKVFDPTGCNACPHCVRLKDLCLIRDLGRPELAGCAQAKSMRCSLKRKYGQQC